MNEYTFEVSCLVEIKVKAESPMEARNKLLQNDDLWYEEVLQNATISNPIKEEFVKEVSEE